MTEYKELVNKLRIGASRFPGYVVYPNNGIVPFNLMPTDLEQAADAIEELQKDLERGQDYYEFWKHKAEQESKMLQVAISNMPCWIPVTERLPEENKVVLIADGRDVGDGWYQNGLWYTPFADIDENHVTHWMPIPEPPKEEA